MTEEEMNIPLIAICKKWVLLKVSSET
jgi:hypothetical protein